MNSSPSFIIKAQQILHIQNLFNEIYKMVATFGDILELQWCPVNNRMKKIPISLK